MRRSISRPIAETNRRFARAVVTLPATPPRHIPIPRPHLRLHHKWRARKIIRRITPHQRNLPPRILRISIILALCPQIHLFFAHAVEFPPTHMARRLVAYVRREFENRQNRP